jgi:hypothetical protein
MLKYQKNLVTVNIFIFCFVDNVTQFPAESLSLKPSCSQLPEFKNLRLKYYIQHVNYSTTKTNSPVGIAFGHARVLPERF